jgi:hypothetical protein
MINEHVTDIEIQRFILEEKKCDFYVVEHIKHCSQCTIKAAEYRLLFEGIKQQDRPVFDFPLADFVVAQLPKSQSGERFDKLFLYTIAFVGIFFLSTVFYLFKDPLLSPASQISPVSAGLIITTIAGMLAFLFIDMYKKYRKQMKAVNFY